MRKLKEKGITLVALVVTIIILLILAGVTLNLALGESGIFSRSKEAADKYQKAEEDESEKIIDIEDMMSEIESGITIEKVVDANPGELEEEGSEKVINSIEDLVFFANSVTKGTTYEGETVKLGLSLDFNLSKSYVNPNRTDYGKYGYDGKLKTLLTSGEGFKPIGTVTNESGYQSQCFKGTFDGNNKIIRNLYINVKAEDNVNDIRIGLFGTNYGTIKNLGLDNCNINGELTSSNTNTLMLGGIAGDCMNFINLCYTSGNLNAIGKNLAFVRTGGIAGQIANNGRNRKLLQLCYH